MEANFSVVIKEAHTLSISLPFFYCLLVFNFSYYDMCSSISKASIGILLKQTQTFWKPISVCIMCSGGR